MGTYIDLETLYTWNQIAVAKFCTHIIVVTRRECFFSIILIQNP